MTSAYVEHPSVLQREILLPRVFISSFSHYQDPGFCYLCLMSFLWLQHINRGSNWVLADEKALRRLLWAAFISHTPIRQMMTLESLLRVNGHLSSPGLTGQLKKSYLFHSSAMGNSERVRFWLEDRNQFSSISIYSVCASHVIGAQ